MEAWIYTQTPNVNSIGILTFEVATIDKFLLYIEKAAKAGSTAETPLIIDPLMELIETHQKANYLKKTCCPKYSKSDINDLFFHIFCPSTVQANYILYSDTGYHDMS